MPIWGSGAAVREWLYAPDFARVLLTVIRKPEMIGLRRAVNIGQNFGLSVRELVDLIVRAVGYRGRNRYDHSMPDGAPRKEWTTGNFAKSFRDLNLPRS